jgi:hypothetical protein
VRQGDPLSPLIFVLAVDLLQAILNKAMNQQLISPPISRAACPNFPVIQYADDTLVVMRANANDLMCLKAILLSFTESTGLKVNFNKSFMMPTNMDDSRLTHFANALSCKKGQLLFTYLGLPLGITKPSLEHFLPMVQRVEKRLCGIVDFLDYGGKLLMVKSVLASLPISYMACLDIPVTIKEQIVKYMRHYLWRKRNTEVQSRGPALIAWTTVCKPKDQGGLGVLNLDTQNSALLLKNLHKFYNRLDIPWVNLVWSSYYAQGHLEVSFWWKAHLKLLDKFKGISRCHIGDGKSTLFWTDLWESECIMHKYPHLLTFSKSTDLSIKQVMETEFLEDLFHLPLSQQAFSEFESLENLCDTTMRTIQQDNIDQWSYIWGNKEFTTKQAYKALIGV